MNSNVLQFQPNKPVPTRKELVDRVRELAVPGDTSKINFRITHLQERMRQRGVTMRQILETLRHGECVSGPKLDDHGDWRIKLSAMVAGRRIQVWVAVRPRRVAVITVF